MNFEKWWESIVEEMEKMSIYPTPFLMYLHKTIASASWAAALKSVEGQNPSTNKQSKAITLLKNLIDKKNYSGNAQEWLHDCRSDIMDCIA